MSGDFQVNGRSLYLKCLGVGSPAVILEAGDGGTVTAMKELQATLAGRTMTCAYSRANLGRSGSAPKPRTAKDVVDDLHGLLAAAKVPGPYVLVGFSAGGMYAQLYARTFPDQVLGVVAMNPLPPAQAWLDAVSKTYTEQEFSSEKRYFGGGNEESIDFVTSSRQLAEAPQAAKVIFEMLVSTSQSCDPSDPAVQTCLKGYPIYEQIMRDVTASWPHGNFTEVAAGEELFNDVPDTVVAALQRIMTAPR